MRPYLNGHGWRIFVLLGWIPLLLSLGCGGSNSNKEQVALIVGSRQIGIQELERDLEFLTPGLRVSDLQNSRIRKKVLDLMISHYLVLEYGHENRITLSENEFKNALERIRKNHTESTFQEALLRSFVNMGEWEGRLAEQLLVRKILRKVTENVDPPTHQEMAEYFELHKNEFRTTRMVKFRQIVAKTKSEAVGVVKRLLNGEDFSDLAKGYSMAPEAEKGGEVGWVKEGELEETMERVLFSLSVGEVSPIVRTPYGYHIFEVLSTRPAGTKALPEVLEVIESRLLRQKREVFVDAWLRDLRKHYRIYRNPHLLDLLE